MTKDPGASDRLVHDDSAGMARLLEIMARLRDPVSGCPWDLVQTFQTIAPYTIEEAYEVADTIEREAWGDLRGELGDLLLQTVYHAQMAEEAGHFGFADVVAGICDKMVARHPHVFGTASRDKSPDQQTIDWEAIKAAERAGKSDARGAGGGTLDGIAPNLPALSRAVKLQKRAARVGFDWPSTAEVLAKMQEESQELVEARDTLSQTEVEEEFGDLLFVMANLARHMTVDPEQALRAANAKFTRRFRQIEAELAKRGKRPEQTGLAEMEAIWQAVKQAERAGKVPD